MADKKAFKWNCFYNGKRCVVEANTQIGAKRKAKAKFGITARGFDLSKIAASIKR